MTGDKMVIIGCQFCDETRAKDPLTSIGVQQAMAAYIAHLVESHWDKLEYGRRVRLESGVPINDAWTRL